MGGGWGIWKMPFFANAYAKSSVKVWAQKPTAVGLVEQNDR